MDDKGNPRLHIQQHIIDIAGIRIGLDRFTAAAGHAVQPLHPAEKVGEEVKLVGKHIEAHVPLSTFGCVKAAIIFIRMPVLHMLSDVGNRGQGPAQHVFMKRLRNLQMNGVVKIGHTGRKKDMCGLERRITSSASSSERVRAIRRMRECRTRCTSARLQNGDAAEGKSAQSRVFAPAHLPFGRRYPP